MAITVKVRSYTRRDGKLMAYINGDNGKSVGVSEDRQPTTYGRGDTQGTRNLIEAFWRAVKAAPDARVDESDAVSFAHHAEDRFNAGDTWGQWFITDISEVGGATVSEDGFYLWSDRLQKLVNLDNLR